MQLLEHIHLTVASISETEHFLQAVSPEFVRRGGGNSADYGPWAHIGNETSYIALTEDPESNSMPELRHIGLLVQSVDELMERLALAGYQPADDSSLDTHPHRRRVYYVDGNGVDWEFVEYLSEQSSLRNDYSL